MNAVIQTMVSLMMVFLYNPNLLPNQDKTGEFYYAAPSTYFADVDKTCTIWNRYLVWGEKYGNYGAYNKTQRTLQVWCYNGKVSDATIKADGRDRSEGYIIVQVGQ